MKSLSLSVTTLLLSLVFNCCTTTVEDLTNGILFSTDWRVESQHATDRLWVVDFAETPIKECLTCPSHCYDSNTYIGKNSTQSILTFDNASAELTNIFHVDYSVAVDNPTVEYDFLKNRVVSHNGRSISCYDINRGSYSWSLDKGGHTFSKLQTLGNRFCIQTKQVKDSLTFTHVMEMHPESGQTKTIIPEIKDVILGYIGEDESTLFYAYQMDDNHQAPIYIKAINKTSSQVKWDSKNKNTDFEISLDLMPIVHGNVVFWVGFDKVICIDKFTGNLRWESDLSALGHFGDFPTVQPLLVKNKLYINTKGTSLTCLDPITGNTLFHIDDQYIKSRHFLYYEKSNIILYATGDIHVVDAVSGEIIHVENAQRAEDYQRDILFDPTTDLFYATTEKHFVALKLNYN